MSTSQASTAAGSSNSVYESLEKYPWDDDIEFQSGLSAILGTNSTPEQASELALRARCFYYSRKFNVDVDFDSYKAYRDSHPSTNPVSLTNGLQNPASSRVSEAPESSGGILPTSSAGATEPAAPYPTSFAHIVELITTGQPIPGIKEIPTTVLEGQGTLAVKPKRKKPWEKEGSTEPVGGAQQPQTREA